MSLPFNLTRDINGYNGFGLPFSEDNFQMSLATGVAQTVTVPDNYQNWVAIFTFEPGANVWVSINGAATSPAGAATATTSEANPTARQVKGGNTLSFITADTSAEVGVSFYWLENYR